MYVFFIFSVEVHKNEKTSFQTCPVNANRCFFNTPSASPSPSTNPFCTGKYLGFKM